MSSSDLSQLVNRLEKVAARLENLSVGSSGSSSSSASSSGSDVGVPPMLAAFDTFVANFVNPFFEASTKIGGDLTPAAENWKQGFAEQRKFLEVASQSKKPDAKVIQDLLAPTSKLLASTVDYRNSKRTSDLFNHLSTLSEGIPALAWVCQEPTPVPFIKEMIASADFYSNKILVGKKGDAVHTEWVKAFKTLLNELAAYVKEFHTTGVSWNAKGGDASQAKVGSSAPAQQTQQAQAQPQQTQQPAQQKADPQKAGLFSALNSGNVTSGLRKVTDDMKTKNRTDKTSVVTEVEKKPATTSQSKAAQPFNGTPKVALEDKKWCVEFQDGNKNIVIEDVDLKQTVYIYKCRNSVITVKGKVNAITIDGCLKVGLQFENVVASVEVVNSKSTNIVVQGKVPMVTSDKSSGLNLYLSKESLETQLISSTSDQINISIPVESEDQDMVELPVPEQYVTKVVNGKLVTTISSHV